MREYSCCEHCVTHECEVLEIVNKHTIPCKICQADEGD